MEKRWSSDTYNGNAVSASDLEAPCDLYPVVEVDRGIPKDGSGFRPTGIMEEHRNITLQQGDPGNYVRSAPENEYVNTSTIIGPMPRKKPLLSLDTLPENAYVNMDTFNNRRPCSLGTDRDMDSSANRPSGSAGSSSSERLGDKSSKIVLITSPNNNTETIPSATTSTGSSRPHDLVILKEPIEDCPTPYESKSAWQFYPQYGPTQQDMDSSEETPSPSSEASPDVVLSEGSIDSLSEEEDAYDSSHYLALEDSDEICSPKSQSHSLLNDTCQNSEAILSPSCEKMNTSLHDVLHVSVTERECGTVAPVEDIQVCLGPEELGVEFNDLAMPLGQAKQPTENSFSALNVKPFASLDVASMDNSFADSSACTSSVGTGVLDPHARPPHQCATANDLTSNTKIKNTDEKTRLNIQVKPQSSQNFDQNRGMVKSQSSQNYTRSSTPAERLINLQDFLGPAQGASLTIQSALKICNRPQALLVSPDRFCCWQQSSEPLLSCRRSRRPLSLHELEQPPSLFPGESSSGLVESRSPRCTCTSRQTQTEIGKPYMLKQSNSFSAMPRSSSWWGRRQDDHREGVKTGSKVNLGVSSLRSAYPGVRRQPGVGFPTSQTAENLRVVNALGSSQSTPSFVGLCHMNCPSKRRGQFESPMSRETGWRYARPVSDSGLFIKHARFGSSRAKSIVPDFLNQISERGHALLTKPAAEDVERRMPSSNRKKFARRLSDPSYSLPQPPRRSESLSGKILLARSLSEPYMKNSSQPVVRGDQGSRGASALAAEHGAIIYENLPHNTEIRTESESLQTRPAESRAESQSVSVATYENAKVLKTQESTFHVPLRIGTVDEAATVPKTPSSNHSAERFNDDFYDSFSSDSLDSDSSSEDCVMEDRPNLGNSDSFDSDTEEGSDSGDNYAGSSEDSSDTISMDDLLTRLGVVTAQDGDADDEDGFLDSSDEEEEDELLLPVTAPSRMCDRPPSPYPGLGDSSDDEHLLPISALYEARSRSERESGLQETPDSHRRPPPTEQDFLEFEILNPEDYGLEHPPSYTDLFPVGMPGLLEMPPSYDDAIRPISVHQDHFDYASFQDHRVNNRLSLQVPWVPPGEEYLANPPPAYDDAVFNASGGRSHDELSYHSPSDSPVRRSRGRRILNGLRRFARKIFK